ncbi:MAG: MBL fold metallo-hydrolase, partial [Clostridia bacterium]|nr:MBL fold metallo-hydrolase [Clostridia bacterium]
MNKFKFRGVGQGLFYTGSLMHGTYNFVFDCGSSSRELYLNKQIDEYVHELSYNRKIKPNIDFMVVSHFHKDHINGIFTLLNECNVKKLYLPYLMGDDTFKKFVLAYISFYDFEGKNQKRNDEDNDGDNIDKRYMLYKRLKSLYGIDEKQLDIDTQVVIAGMDDATPPIEFCVPNNQNKYWEFKIFHRHLDEKIIIELNFEIKSLMQRCGYTNF